MGMPALAMTDHGNVFGAYDFYKQATAAGVKPIIGMEGYLAPGSRFDRKRVAVGGATAGEDNPGEMYTHMTLLAENNEGLHNLFRLSAWRAWRATTTSPAWTASCSASTATGVIATTGCPSGEVNRLLQQGRYDDARQAAADYRDIFGAGNFFCEVMDHGIDIERRHRDDLLRLARDLSLPFVATNDLHYTYAGRRAGPRGAAVRPDGQDPRRPEPVQVRRARLLPQVGRGDAQALARDPGGLRQHAAHRRAGGGVLRRGWRPHAALPGARGAHGGDVAARGGAARPGPPLPGWGPGGPRPPGGLRARRHLPDGLPRLLPRHGGPGPLREGERHPGRSGPRHVPPGR